MTDQVAGTILSERYALEDRIGIGGMATVYRAIDLTTGSRVAVKILNREFLRRNPTEAERNIKRFRREGEILKLLVGNPYVVQFVEQGESPNGHHFIAMELLEGEQLRFLIGRGKTAMGLRTFAYHAAHLIRGLTKIHAKNLIHRDLAPDNIVIVKTREGLPWPKFLDFGIGKSVSDDLDEVTQMLTIMGKPQHFSPEQARGEALGVQSDVYSLGVLLYEMLTGYVPIEVHGLSDLRKIQRDPPVPIGNWREGSRTPPELQDAIMRCLSKEPAARPELEDLLDVVERFSDRLDAGEEFAPSADGGRDPRPKVAAAADSATRPAVARSGSGAQEFGQGDKIGRFEVRERIGRGGMGLVYRAWDPVLEREVAIKVASRVEEEKARRAVLREAQASSHLRSENIVTIYDAGTEAGCPYIAMEYVRGPTLAEIIEAEGALPGPRFWSLARGMLDGLIYAHEGEKPVIHRDLKPANILCAGAVAKITDFGIATVTAAQRLTMKARDATTAGGAEGSVVTMSPEQANNKPADHRSDIYSLGCILYVMATGKPPFEGNQIAILYQHVTRMPVPPSKLNPALDPPGLDAIIMKCLEKDPAKRWQSVRAVKAALEPLFEKARPEPAPWRRTALAAALLVGVVVLATLITVSLLDRRGDSAPGVFSLVQVAGASVLPDKAGQSHFTRASPLEIEVASQTAGELRATVSADWLPKPVPHTFTLSAGGTTTIAIPLPDPGEHDPAKFQIVLEREDGAGVRRELTVIRDRTRPKVSFRAYGVTHEPSQDTPLRVVRIQDVSVVVEDVGGFDDAGDVRRLSVAWDENPHNVTFTRKREEGPAGIAWMATVTAKDRAGNVADVPQSVHVILPDFVMRKPGAGVATGSRTVLVDVAARLLDPAKRIAGLDADDLDLGDRALQARALVGTRSSEAVAMARVPGGYAAELELPADSPQDVDFEVEILLDGEPVQRFRQRFDSVPPLVTASCGGTTLTSAATYPKRQALFAQALPTRTEEVECRIADGPHGVAGATVLVRIGESAPESVQVDPAGRFRLPRTTAEEFVVRLAARDQAGNSSALEFLVIRKGLQVLTVQLGAREADADGNFFVQDDEIGMRITTVGVPASDRVFAQLLDDRGAVQETVELLRLEDPQVFGTTKLRLSPEGATCVVRSLRVLFGKDATSARSYSPPLRVVCDREPPSLSVTVDGSTEEVVGKRPATRFPTLRVRICDNVGLAEASPEKFASWTRSDGSAPDVTLVPASPPAALPTCGPSEISFLIAAPPGPPVENRYVFTIEARDRAGRSASRKFTIQVAPSGVALLSIGDHASWSRFAESAERPLVLKGETVPVTVRAPADPSLSCTLVVRAFPEGGEEIRKSYPLESNSRMSATEYVVPLPRAGDGRLIDRGRIVFLLEDAGSQRPDELATVYYLVDRDPPSWSVSRGARTFNEAERRDWIKVAALDDVRIVVTDGPGSGFLEDAVVDPDHVVGVVQRSSNQLTIRLKDDPAFRGAETKEPAFSVRDAAGNVTPVALKLARSKDRPEVKSLLAADGRVPMKRDDLIILDKPRLTITIDNEAVGFQGVRWILKRSGVAIRDGVIELAEGSQIVSETIEWPVTGRSEPYGLELYAQGGQGVQAEALENVRVLVDTTPPAFHLVLRDRTILKNERIQLKDFEELRLEVSDSGADLGPNPVTVEIVGAGGVRVPAAVSPTRDPKTYRIRPAEPLPSGSYVVRITARDLLANEEEKSFEVSLNEPVRAMPASVPASRPSAGATTRAGSERRIGNDAIRQRDEERTGITLKPVWATQDRTGPPKFFMSQTEVTNEQFLRFVDVLRKDPKEPIPRELRAWSDLTSVKKRVEDMSFRFPDFRRDPALPVVEVESEVAVALAAWAGGRLPTKEEWIGAAGRYLLAEAEYPVYVDRGVARSGDYWMRDPAFAVFQRPGVRESRRVPVTELLRSQSNAPFGIVGFAGNVAEWVAFEPGSRRVMGTMGGSYKYPYTNDVNNPRLDREPRFSAADAGIRVVWPAQARTP